MLGSMWRGVLYGSLLIKGSHLMSPLRKSTQRVVDEREEAVPRASANAPRGRRAALGPIG